MKQYHQGETLSRPPRLGLEVNALYVGKRAIIRDGNRYKIYLPAMYKDLWEQLRGRKVHVYIVIRDDESGSLG